MSEPADEFLGVPEVARLLRVSDRSVLRALTAGKLPGRKVGKKWRISRAALMRWFEQPEQQGVIQGDDGDKPEQLWELSGPVDPDCGAGLSHSLMTWWVERAAGPRGSSRSTR